MEDNNRPYDADKKTDDDFLDFKFDDVVEEEDVLDLVDLVEKGDGAQDAISAGAMRITDEEAVDDVTVSSEDESGIEPDELSLDLEEDAPEDIETVDDVMVSSEDELGDELGIEPDELVLNLEEDAPEDIDVDIETAFEGLEDISGEAGDTEEETAESSVPSEDRIEALITKTVEDTVERVVREAMVTVAEKVIKEAIDALRQSLESFEDRGPA